MKPTYSDPCVQFLKSLKIYFVYSKNTFIFFNFKMTKRKIIFNKKKKQYDLYEASPIQSKILTSRSVVLFSFPVTGGSVYGAHVRPDGRKK